MLFSYAINILIELLLLFSQSDFREGYIIDINGDTLYGEIDYRGDLLNCRHCEFRLSSDEEALIFSAGEVFAEYRVNGEAKLYYYQEALGDHYYIETREGQLVELVDPSVVVEGFDKRDYWAHTNRHVGILKAAFADAPEIQKELDHVQMSSKSLVKYTARYHDYVCEGEACIIYEKQVKKSVVRFGPVAGSGLSVLRIDSHLLHENVDFHQASMPLTLGASFDVGLPSINEKLSLQMDLLYSQADFEGVIQLEYPR